MLITSGDARVLEEVLVPGGHDELLQDPARLAAVLPGPPGACPGATPADPGAAKRCQKLVLAPGRSQAERLTAPELVDLEVIVALALADLTALPLRRAPQRPLLARCWELRDDLTVYDASYVALAEALDISLLSRRPAAVTGHRPTLPYRSTAVSILKQAPRGLPLMAARRPHPVKVLIRADLIRLRALSVVVSRGPLVRSTGSMRFPLRG